MAQTQVRWLSGLFEMCLLADTSANESTTCCPMAHIEVRSCSRNRRNDASYLPLSHIRTRDPDFETSIGSRDARDRRDLLPQLLDQRGSGFRRTARTFGGDRNQEHVAVVSQILRAQVDHRPEQQAGAEHQDGADDELTDEHEPVRDRTRASGADALMHRRDHGRAHQRRTSRRR